LTDDITNDLLLKKHSSLIQINSQMTLQQRKLFNLLLLNSNINNWDKNNLSYIEIKKIKELLGITHKNNKFIKDNLKKIKDISIEYNVLEKDKEVWGNFSLIQEPEIKYGILSYSLPYRIRETIETGKPPFALLDMNITSTLTNKYSIVFYELFVDYYSKKIKKLLLPKLTIIQFKTLLGIEKEKYASMKDLKKYVINKSLLELKLNANIEATYEIEKILNEYYIKFDVKFNKNIKTIEPEKIMLFLNAENNKEILNSFIEAISEDNKALISLSRVFIKNDNIILVFVEDGFEIEYKLEEEETEELKYLLENTRLMSN